MRRIPKRSLLPPTENTRFKEVSPDKVTIVPEMEYLFSEVETIIGTEYARLKRKLEVGKELDHKDLRSLNQCADTLIKLSKERRERDKSNEEENLSDEELYELTKEALKELEAKIAKKRKTMEGVVNEGKGDSE